MAHTQPIQTLPKPAKPHFAVKHIFSIFCKIFPIPSVFHVLLFPVMPLQPAAPSEADAPRPWARAILHAQIPATLKLLLLALLSAFSKAEAPRAIVRRLRQDWLFSTNTDFNEDLDSAQTPYTLRRILQLRAEIGWLMRGSPNRGMALSGHRAPVLCPAQPARAPP